MIFIPLYIAILGLAFLGLALSLGSVGIVQPDWALALLLATLLARRGSWPWVLPSMLVHDLTLYWSVWGAFPLSCLLPFFLAGLDSRIGAGLPQRLALMALVSSAMLWHGAGTIQWLLTLTLCIPIWYLLVHIHEQQYA